ncbi:DDB1- and CUL4-associated factor 8-like [Lineus longissimus]|uniref:DDB1- and CUL4-associated factor 8-like n=1 Tax=Lineus longissimus TaxID=88925 RepID=UPI002B4F71F6
MADSRDEANGEGHLNNHCSETLKQEAEATEDVGRMQNHTGEASGIGENKEFMADSSDDLETRGSDKCDKNTTCVEESMDRSGEANLCEDVAGDTLILGRLKKDDSGIEMEKSPSKESAALSEESQTNPCDSDAVRDDSGAASQSEMSKDDAKNSPKLEEDDSMMDSSYVRDMVDTEDSEATGGYDVTGADNESGSDVLRVRRKRHLGRRLSSSSDSDNDTRSTSSEKSAKSAKSSDSDTEMDVDLPPIKQWQLYYDIYKREYGLNPRRPQSIFRSRLTSNISLVQRLKLQYKMEKHDGCVNALHFNNTGTLLASGSDDLKVVVWDWARNKDHMVFESGHRSNVFQAKFMPYSGDCHIVTCARDGQVRLAELSLTGVCKATKKLAQHKGAAHKLALQYDSPHEFLSCGEDAVTFQIDLRQEKANKLHLTKEGDRKIALYSIHSNPSNSYEFCVGGRDHYIRIYDKRKITDDGEATVKKYCPHHMVDSELKANVTCCVYNYNGQEVLGTYNDEDIYLFDTNHSDGAEFIKRYRGHRNNATVKGVNFFGPKSEYIISGSDCSNVFLWEKGSERIVHFFEADVGGVINVLEPHPTGPFLATSGLDSDVKIWAPTAEEATNLEGLKRITKKNKKERDEERMQEPDVLDNQMFWFLMHHLRRSSRRRARAEGEVVSSSSENNSNENSDTEDSDNPGDGRVQCVSS